MTTDIERIDPADARSAQGRGALLVCAYEDEQKCARIKLEGGLSLAQFRAQLASIPRDRQIIFY